MLEKIYNYINYQALFFLLSIFLVFSSINLFYLSSEAPDYIFYIKYFDYFFQETTSTGRENGLLYFFLVSCVIKIQEINITPATVPTTVESAVTPPTTNPLCKGSSISACASLLDKSTEKSRKEVRDKINHYYKEIGGYIVSKFAIKQLPGESQHFGASMPMSNSPHGVETDILGRPFNLKNTHVIDTSILPNIPSTPTTLLVMANASRIADQSLKGEIK